MSALHCIFAVGLDISILRALMAAAITSFMSPLNPPNPCPLLFSNSGGQRSCFQEEVLHLVRYLSAHDFIYAKILFH